MVKTKKHMYAMVNCKEGKGFLISRRMFRQLRKKAEACDWTGIWENVILLDHAMGGADPNGWDWGEFEEDYKGVTFDDFCKIAPTNLLPMYSSWGGWSCKVYQRPSPLSRLWSDIDNGKVKFQAEVLNPAQGAKIIGD